MRFLFDAPTSIPKNLPQSSLPIILRYNIIFMRYSVFPFAYNTITGGCNTILRFWVTDYTERNCRISKGEKRHDGIFSNSLVRIISTLVKRNFQFLMLQFSITHRLSFGESQFLIRKENLASNI